MLVAALFSPLEKASRVATETNVPSGVQPLQIDFKYDWLGRMIERRVTQAGAVIKRTTYLYDGWRPVRELEFDSTGVAAERVYTWGPNGKGDLDGESAVGGLIEVMETRSGTTTKSLAVEDGLGNVSGLVDETSGALVASYAYGPYGEALSATGARAGSCPLRYQGRLWDEDLQLYWWNHRWYDPSARSFLSRDPMREAGGINGFSLASNQPFNLMDPLGGQAVPRGAYDPAWEEYERWHRANQVRFGQEHPWLARIFGFGNAVSGAFAVPAGLAGPDAQSQAIASPFTAAAGLTMGTPEDNLAMINGVAGMTQTPFGQGQLFGTGVTILTVPLVPKIPLVVSSLRLPALSGEFLPWATRYARIGSSLGLPAEGGGVFRRTANIGEFSELTVPMQKRFVLEHAEAAGIGLDGVKISINRQTDLIGKNLFGQASRGNRITLYPDAFRDSETLIRTLSHERTHLMQFDIYGIDAVKWGPNRSLMERSAWDIEDTFVEYWNLGGAN